MVLLYLFSAFLLAPKIDLIGFGGSALRAEDFIWLFAVAYCMIYRSRANYAALPKYFYYFFFYIAFSCVGFLINYSDAGLGGAFYILRQVQYCSWGVMALAIAPEISRANMAKHLQFVSIVLALWGGLELMGLIPKVGKFTEAGGRLSINTSGPFETSVVLAILAFAARGWLLKGALSLLVFFTQARITIVGAFVALIGSRPKLALPLAATAIMLIGVLPLAESALQGTRFASSSSPAVMYSTMRTMWETAPIFRNQLEYMDVAGYRNRDGTGYANRFVTLAGDRSYQIRAYRWSVIVKAWLQRPVQVIVGFGPGYFGQAVDSSIIRLFAESGVIGTVFYGLFLLSLLVRPRRSLTWISAVTILVTAVFIDIFWASKVMVLVWFLSSWESVWRTSLTNGLELQKDGPSKAPRMHYGPGRPEKKLNSFVG